MTTAKPKLAMYWAASCGGCEISLANIHEAILEVDSHFDFMFCPCLLDTKKADIEALPDGNIAVTLFNGALRTTENLEMAELLRRKSQIFVAFGSCSATGGIPALANHHGLDHLLHTVFSTASALDNPDNIIPRATTAVPEGELHLPSLLPQVLAVHQAVSVDYTMPGCPPEPEQIVAVVRHVASGSPLPETGGMLGCTDRAVCDECPREKRGVLTGQLLRPYQAIPEAGWCLLEQGQLCLGAATRGGCQALCPTVNMHCTGCYGPLDQTGDCGTAALSAMAAAVHPGDTSGKDEAVVQNRLRTALAGVADPLGTFYRYSLAETAVTSRRPEVER